MWSCPPCSQLVLRSLISPGFLFFFLNQCSGVLFYKFYLFIYFYFWLCWVFTSVRGPSLVAASGGHSSSRCAGLSLSQPLLLQSTGSRHAGSVVVAHRPSCSTACEILPDQGSNPCPLHWQADSQLLHHQGSPLQVLRRTQSPGRKGCKATSVGQTDPLEANSLTKVSIVPKALT